MGCSRKGWNNSRNSHISSKHHTPFPMTLLSAGKGLLPQEPPSEYLTCLLLSKGEGNGTLLQYSCLENPMDGGAWWATVHGVTKSRTWLSIILWPAPFLGFVYCPHWPLDRSVLHCYWKLMGAELHSQTFEPEVARPELSWSLVIGSI